MRGSPDDQLYTFQDVKRFVALVNK